MDKKEYEDRLSALKVEFSAKQKELAKEFALSNNPVKIGDIITDHYKTIRVERFSWGFGFKQPCVYYSGTRLTKKGEPAKREAEDNVVVQENIKEINGHPYKFEVK